MRKIFILLSVLTAVSAGDQPIMAVLDASPGEELSPNASAIVARYSQ